MIAATDRQREVLKFIRTFQRKHGYTPTVREIGEARGLRSSSTVQHHIYALERKRLVQRVPEDRPARALVITTEGHALLDAVVEVRS